MNKVKLLDCTLRDGGYINNWEFGEENIRAIIQKLVAAKIDIIECGFLNPQVFNNDFSLFHSIEKIQNFIKEYESSAEFVFMLNIKDVNEKFEAMLLQTKPDFWGIRLSFKPKEIQEALLLADKLINKGYRIYFQPMLTDCYEDKDFIELVNKVNNLSPYAFYIVDTFGSMYQDDLIKKFSLLDRNLSKEIKIGFHSHNNLQLSFSNALALLSLKSKREIIIDSSVFGMGRGAGNLSTEIITKYMNQNFGSDYRIATLLSVYDEFISKIYAQNPWGYSIPYFLSAMNDCHPNYASYLLSQIQVSQGLLNAETIANIFKQIPDDKKAVYDKELIKKLYDGLQ